MKMDTETEAPICDSADTSRLINEAVGTPHVYGTAPAWIDVAFTWAGRTASGALGVLALGVIAKAVAVIFMMGWRLL